MDAIILYKLQHKGTGLFWRGGNLKYATDNMDLRGRIWRRINHIRCSVTMYNKESGKTPMNLNDWRIIKLIYTLQDTKEFGVV